ncbi:hypothetical protein AB0I28_32030 [Phytomonospora sp. NPDC050363]|uniref:hypothetical protein n=1 Tax=Phytomonospora sp. NPDC050363 TaxID=3155642 RepID=UPI0033F013C2
MTEPDDVAQPFVLIAANPDADMERRLPPVWFGVVRALVAEFLLRDLVKIVSAIGMFGGMWLAAIEWPLGVACMVAGGALGWGAVGGEDTEYERYTPPSAGASPTRRPRPARSWRWPAPPSNCGRVSSPAAWPWPPDSRPASTAGAPGITGGEPPPERIYQRRWRRH